MKRKITQLFKPLLENDTWSWSDVAEVITDNYGTPDLLEMLAAFEKQRPGLVKEYLIEQGR